MPEKKRKFTLNWIYSIVGFIEINLQILMQMHFTICSHITEKSTFISPQVLVLGENLFVKRKKKLILVTDESKKLFGRRTLSIIKLRQTKFGCVYGNFTLRKQVQDMGILIHEFEQFWLEAWLKIEESLIRNKVLGGPRVRL